MHLKASLLPTLINKKKNIKKLGGYGKPINETGIKSFWNPVKAAIKFVTKVVTAPIK